MVNRKRTDYASTWPQDEARTPGIVASSNFKLAFNGLRIGGRKHTNAQIDDAWLADAELVVLRTEPVGKTDKTVVLEDFEVPRSD